MRDAFLIYARPDEPFARALTEMLARRAVELGHPVELWPQMRLLPRVDDGLVECRHAVIVVSADFLRLSYPRKELDGLANRKKVVTILYGVEERDVAEYSPKLATAAFPGTLAETFIRLLRLPDSSDGTT